ncbi:hypothetical protein [Vulcanisaeta souniana]|uniref:Uncharacterized protein n=2 Tax=Vulcanisaeta souniana TaxID=164452 RepID=A0A830E7V1_9CREN|nr:hypothetical protein [Vulcanisaeta souniana]BDR93195.1 hypothetical protein Vsou_22880 [Vulcanisaeta souniana JCM 11219]GGI78324.1 hypothetical protein GCM10007112_13950 [Vulcanisaeta souniana JCM 11219]
MPKLATKQVTANQTGNNYLKQVRKTIIVMKSDATTNKPSPGIAGAGRYGVVRTKTIVDTSGIPDLRVYIYDPEANDWVELSDEELGYIQDNGRVIGGGFIWHGFTVLHAIPRERLGKFMRYVIEWMSELPRRPIMVNEGVRVRVTRDEFGNVHVYIDRLDKQ